MAANKRKCSSWALAVNSSNAVVDPIADGDVDKSFTPSLSTTCRCRHLEECMFPRYLNLDAKPIDDFSMKTVHPDLHGKNAARLYVESLHLKPFVKDEETIISEQSPTPSRTPKRPCLPLRRNLSESKETSCDQCTNQDRDEGITDRSKLSQMYFGGFDGKRTCYLSNDDSREPSSGVAASYHHQLRSNTSILPPMNHQSKDKNPVVPKLPLNEDFNRCLLSEKRLTKLRNQLGLHDRLDEFDNAVVSDPPDNLPKEDGDFKRLQGLIKPISGYIPLGVHVNMKKMIGNSHSIQDSYELSSPMSETAQDTNIQTPNTILKRKGPHSLEVTPQHISVDSSSAVTARTERTTFNTSLLNPSHDSVYQQVVQQGKDQLIAANLLLEAFRSSRKRYMSSEDFKCAWCALSNKNDKSNYACCAGDTLMQCLECNLIGCGSSLGDRACGKQHIMLHFLLSGHRYGE